MGIQTIFWYVTMCSYQWKPTLQANLTLSPYSGQKMQAADSYEHWQLATRLYGNTFQKTLILTVILHCTIDIIQLVQLLSVESNSTCKWSRSFSLHKFDSRRIWPLAKYSLVELITATKLQHNKSNAILLKFHVQCEPETFQGFWNNTLRQGENIPLTLIRYMPSPWEFMLTISV